MSNNKHWSEYKEHTYERYVAWMDWKGWKPLSHKEWSNTKVDKESSMAIDKVNCYPLFNEDPSNHESTPRTSADLRADFLEVVKGYVTKDRNVTHGDAEDNFADIAGLINIALSKKLKEPLGAIDVATVMICVKLSRIKTSPDNLDHWHDMAGYAACGGGIIMRKKE
jgi:hypothetical protein